MDKSYCSGGMIAITGATGFIGSRVVRRLLERGEAVRALGRRAPEGLSVEFRRWDASSGADLEGCSAVVHLAGEPVAQRWSAAVKERIRSSRIEGTRAVVRAIAGSAIPPATLICASAIGYYGDRGDEVLRESSPAGTGFLPDVCMEWENSAKEAERYGVRVVVLRTGIVLGPAGALKKMLPPFRLGVGGPLGSGRQWMSWIHVQDHIELILFALSEELLRGPVNAVAPNPVRNADFTQALASAIHRPAFMPVPQFALRVMFGEMAGTVLESQRVVPEAAERAGFRFRFAEIGPALEDAVRERGL